MAEPTTTPTPGERAFAAHVDDLPDTEAANVVVDVGEVRYGGRELGAGRSVPDLISTVPVSLGSTPRESIVVVALSARGRLLVTMRAGIDDLTSRMGGPLAAQIAAALSEVSTAAALAFAYTDAEPVAGGQADNLARAAWRRLDDVLPVEMASQMVAQVGRTSFAELRGTTLGEVCSVSEVVNPSDRRAPLLKDALSKPEPPGSARATIEAEPQAPTMRREPDRFLSIPDRADLFGMPIYEGDPSEAGYMLEDGVYRGTILDDMDDPDCVERAIVLRIHDRQVDIRDLPATTTVPGDSPPAAADVDPGLGL